MEKAGHHAAFLRFLILVLFCETCTVDCAVAVRLCGQKLVNIIKHLCNHKYYQSSQTMYNPGYYANQRQPRSGIVESCCWKQCTYAYLKSYCDDDSDDTTTAMPISLTTKSDTDTIDSAATQAFSQESTTHRRIRHPYSTNRRRISTSSSVVSNGPSDVFQSVTSSSYSSGSSAVGRGRRPMKTFRSLFHLLSYLNQVLSQTTPKSDSDQSITTQSAPNAG